MSDDVIKPHKNGEPSKIRRALLKVLLLIAAGFIVFHVTYFVSGRSAKLVNNGAEDTPLNEVARDLGEIPLPSEPEAPKPDPEFQQCMDKVTTKILQLWENDRDPGVKNASDPCSELWRSIDMDRSLITDFLEQETPWNQTAVTMVTQTSYGRIDHLLASIKMWGGPVSVTVYVKRDNVEEIVQKICDTKEFFTRRDIGLHFAPVQGKYYPYNYLRNVALNNSRTSHVFLLDVDFNPMPGLHDKLVDYIKAGTPGEKEVMVIPAFEWSPISMLRQPEFPQGKQELMDLWVKEYLFPFRLYRFYGGHGPTNFTRWRSADKVYPAEWGPQFEPYIVMKASDAPRYWQKFVGPYRDKISQIQETHSKGFEFVIPPDIFILHSPHPKMIDKAERQVLYACAAPVYEEFKKHIFDTYGVELQE